MKKKQVLLIVLAVVVVAVGAFSLWYTRPMTLEKMYPKLDWDSFTSMYVRAEIALDSGYGPSIFLNSRVYTADLTPEDETFQAIVDSLRERTFRRSLRSLLPYGTQTHPNRAGDFRWRLYFYQDSSEGANMEFTNFYGNLRSWDAINQTKAYTLSTSGKDAWVENIFNIIAASLEPEELQR